MAEYDIYTAGLRMLDINDKEGIETMLYAVVSFLLRHIKLCSVK
jgi:hypothetical protein